MLRKEAHKLPPFGRNVRHPSPIAIERQRDRRGGRSGRQRQQRQQLGLAEAALDLGEGGRGVAEEGGGLAIAACRAADRRGRFVMNRHWKKEHGTDVMNSRCQPVLICKL